MPDQKDRSRKYYLKNKRKVYFKSKEWRETHPEHSLWKGAKWRANKKGLDFTIEVGDITIPEICPVLKVKLEPKSRFAPTLDRMDSTQGYTKNNIWVISKLANLMKSDASLEELERFAEWVNQLKH